MEKTKNIAKIILISLGSLCLLSLLWFFFKPFQTAIRMSFMDFAPYKGMEGSPDVGFEHYINFFDSETFPKLMTNTVVMNLFTLIFGAVYVFLAVWAINSVKNIFAKGGIALIFALPFAVPSTVIAAIFTQFLTEGMSKIAGWLILALAQALPLAALFSLGGIFTKDKPIKSALTLTLAFVATKLIFFLFEDFGIQYMLMRPENMGFSEVFGTYIYAKGMMSPGGYSPASALTIIRFLFNLIPAAAGCVLLILTLRKKKAEISCEEKKTAPIVTLIFLVIPLIVALFSFTACIGDEVLDSDFYDNSYEIVYAVVSLAVLAVPLIAYSSHKISFPLIIVLALAGTMAHNIIGQFIAFHEMDLHNTATGVIYMSFKSLPLLAILFAVCMKMGRSIGSKLATIPMAAGTAFVMTWSDFQAPLTLLFDNDAMPASYISRQAILASENMDVSVNLIEFLIVPFIALVICVMVGVLIMFVVDKLENRPVAVVPQAVPQVAPQVVPQANYAPNQQVNYQQNYQQANYAPNQQVNYQQPAVQGQNYSSNQ